MSIRYIDTLNQLGLDGNPLRSIRRTLISQATQDLKKYLRTRGPPPAWYLAEEQCESACELLERARDLAGGALDLSSSGLTSLPSEVADMLSVISREGEEFRKVSSVLLSKNKLHVVPSELSMLNLLRDLDISDNKLGLSTPETLQCMILPALKILNVSRNGLICLTLEAIIDSLSDRGALLSALIADGNLLERFPRNLRNICSIRELSFASNALKIIDVDLRCLEKIEVQ
jgi:Leucine-rich repeat (LRR) protein